MTTVSNSRLQLKSGWKYNSAAKTMRPGYLQRRMREYRAALATTTTPCSPSSMQSFSPQQQSPSGE